MVYITVEQVDSLLGSEWADPAAKPLAVQQANDWLTAKGVPVDADDDRITRAGAYLAKMAAAGTLYADTRGDVKRKRVKADSVESETEYADGSRAALGDMAYVTDLLKPWLNPFGASVRMLKRL